MGEKIPFYIQHLDTEYRKRKIKNDAYSIRAFAKLFDIDFSQFSKILKRKIILSPEMADNISKKLLLDSELRKKFILSAAEEKKCSSLNRLDNSLTDCK